MTRRTQRWQNWVKVPLAAAVAVGISAPASAFQFNLGSINGSLDTTLTAGESWRTQAPDQRFIAQGNLGPSYAYTDVGASSNNNDDGDLNFKKGHPYSKIVKGSTDLYASYSSNSQYLSRVGGFIRGRYWYDFQLMDGTMATDPVGQSRPLNPEARDHAAGTELMDAYVFSDWNLGQVPLGIRYGRQVLSWGESTFIQNGINVINPVDASAFHEPGAELKDVLLPVEMLYMSAGVTDNITLEGFWQTKWRPTRIDDCGTFFSTHDFIGDGCGPVLLAPQLPDYQAYQQGYVSPRLGDKRPSNDDEYGVAMRWYLPSLNQSELGFYYIHYHSRLPYVSGVVDNPQNPSLPAYQHNNASYPYSNFPSYFVEYPSNIHLYGVSINTSLPGGWSLGAEYSFRDNLPLQWNAFELLYGGLQLPYSKIYQQYNGQANNLAGQTLPGYDRFKVSQLQFTLIQFFDQVLGASQLSFVTEFGADYVHNLPDHSAARYGRSGIFGIGSFTDPSLGVSCTTPQNTTGGLPTNVNTQNCTDTGFTTKFSWGYRMRFVLDYPNVIDGVNLHPELAWSQDVEGYSPEPGGNFVQGRKAIGLGLKAVYLNKYTANINYTNYFGGYYNVMSDRDNISLSVSYSF